MCQLPSQTHSLGELGFTRALSREECHGKVGSSFVSSFLLTRAVSQWTLTFWRHGAHRLLDGAGQPSSPMLCVAGVQA